MIKESFEPLDTYKPVRQKLVVNEALSEAKDDDGILGSIVDKGLSFVPRAMRFNKAKKVMKKSLAGYTKKAKNLVQKFSKSLDKRVDKIENDYKKLKKEKLKPLVEDGKREEAVKLAKDYLKELEEYRKEQVGALQKGINNILESYTNSIHNRIDNPGFVLNVELSGRGKGELKAKWQELVSIQNTKIEEYKTDISTSTGWKKIDDMISELTGFVETRRSGGDVDIALHVQDAIHRGADEYLIKVHLRVSGGRPKVEEKGVLIGENPENLEFGESGIRKVAELGEYQYNARPYKLLIKGSKDEFVRPYIKVANKNEPYYGDVFSLDIREKSKEEMQRGAASVIPKQKKKEDDKEEMNKATQYDVD